MRKLPYARRLSRPDCLRPADFRFGRVLQHCDFREWLTLRARYFFGTRINSFRTRRELDE